ncbi:MAG: hypothetical protein IT453_10295 [Planctomycetes bacterium]|nr:hypothetical protein [Planctomycetota bacterium]
MNDESKTTPDPIRPRELATKPAAPARTDRASSPLPEKADVRHPSRLEFGDKPDDTANPSDRKLPVDARTTPLDRSARGESDTDAGEGHKGPRVDASKGPNDHAKKNAQSNVSERQHSAPPRPPMTAEPRKEAPKHQHEDDGRKHMGPDPKVTQPNGDVTSREVAKHEAGMKSKDSKSGDSAKK